MSEGTYNLRSNTQLTFHSLKVGAAAIVSEDFVDARGATRHAPRAGLWIYYREDSDQDRAVRVHAGESLTVADYKIDVLEITAEPPGIVKLRVSEMVSAA